MATIATYLPTTLLTAHIPNIKAVDSASSVLFQIIDTDNSVTVFEATLDTWDSTATLYNVRDLIEEYLRTADLQQANFSVTAGGSTKSFTAIYYAMATSRSADQILYSDFFTSLKNRSIDKYSTTRLYFMAKAKNHIEPTCTFVYTDSAGESKTFQWASEVGFNLGYDDAEPTGLGYTYTDTYQWQVIIATKPALCYLEFSYNSLLAALTDTFGLDAVELNSVMIYTVQQVATFFFDEHRPRYRFWFKNVFNVWELCAPPATTTAQPKAEHEIATVGGVLSAYDRQNSKTYEMQTAPLTHDEMRLMEQLAYSHHVKVMYPNADTLDIDSLPDVIVELDEAELSDNREHTHTTKLSWQYADSRPHSDTDDDDADGIFNFNYDYQYN